MKAIRLAVLSALCAGLLACTASPPPPPKAPDPPPAPPVPIDGTYRGTSTRFQSDSRRCPHPGLVLLTVFDSKFQYRWDYRTYIDGEVGADGTVQGTGPGISLMGKRDGRTMTGDVTNGECGLHFTVLRQKD